MHDVQPGTAFRCSPSRRGSADRCTLPYLPDLPVGGRPPCDAGRDPAGHMHLFFFFFTYVCLPNLSSPRPDPSPPSPSRATRPSGPQHGRGKGDTGQTDWTDTCQRRGGVGHIRSCLQVSIRQPGFLWSRLGGPPFFSPPPQGDQLGAAGRQHLAYLSCSQPCFADLSHGCRLWYGV